MRHCLLFTILLLVLPICLSGQNLSVSGTIVDNKSGEEIIGATVRLLAADSTFITGTSTDVDGKFTVEAPENGHFILKMSGVGYTDVTRNIEFTDSRNIDLGIVRMSQDAVMLDETVVTGMAKKVVLKEDTFVYNASAYRTPEGSAVEELVKRLPGAQVSDDGTIKINGKEVKKILVDGKEFMTGDTKTALKNLPTSIIDRIKSYDEKSDLAKVTGIDDGEEQTVLDFGIKKGMNKGLMTNIDAAIGTHNRYAERGMGAYFNANHRFMLMGNANNVNDMGFPGGGGGPRFGGSQNGLNATKMIGANYNYDDDNHLKLDASLRWNHSNGDVRARTSEENFVSTAASFSNSLSQGYTRSDSWDGRLRIKWTPDTLTDITFRPNFTIRKSDSRRMETSASFNSDPYDYSDDPLADIDKLADEESLMVNSRQYTSISYGNQKSANAMLQMNRKLGAKGRNLTLRTEVGWGNNDNTQLSYNDVHLYQILAASGADSTYQTNRYNITPTRNRSFALQTTYSEPIAKKMFLQFSYKYQYRYNKSDRSTYDFSELGEDFFSGLTPSYRDWQPYLSRLTKPVDEYLDSDLSRYSEYRNYIHDIQLMYRWIQSKFNLNAGIMVQPQRSRFIQDYRGLSIDTTRNVVNWSPTLNFRYRFSKVSNFRINYRGTSAQPSMSDLLDIVDDSDPLNITRGNPGLKPSFTNSLRIFYNTYIQEYQRAMMTYFNFQTTRNSIANKVTYDETTGGRMTQPVNINGNWNMQAAVMFNTALDSVGVWNINTFTDVNYNNYVGFLSLGKTGDAQRNVTRTTSVGERLSATYRNSWLEVDLNGSLNYTHARNKLQAQSNLDTWQFSYGFNLNIDSPWGTSFATDLHMNSRRGYNDKSLNTNELVWNAQVSHSFLKGKPLTVMLQFYDVLQKQSTFSRTINSMRRSDTEYNAINSYVMLHAVYKLNLFGGKNARKDRDDGPPDFDGDGKPGDRLWKKGDNTRRNTGIGGRPPHGGF
ncbi:MAG: outer membrane beta-barrel protein [Prevotella sp.]|nr:outer membrane beta-barrel protein [Prevotella sp.]